VADPRDWNVLDREVVRAHHWSPSIDALLVQVIEARKLFEIPAAELAATRAHREQRDAITAAAEQIAFRRWGRSRRRRCGRCRVSPRRARCRGQPVSAECG